MGAGEGIVSEEAWTLEGKVCIVTGASSGVGRISALRLADAGAHVVLAVRNVAKVKPVYDAILQKHGEDRASVLEMDLSSLKSVKLAADAFLTTGKPLHVLMNNAGLAGIRGQTEDGFELAFGTNHLGHYLFTELLLDKLKESAPARVINVASEAHYQPKKLDLDSVKEPTGAPPAMAEYGRSKLCNVLHAKSLAKRLEGTGVTTYSLHPGVVATDVWRAIPKFLAWIPKLFMLSEEEGAKTQVYCATAPELSDKSGLYYDKSQEKKPSKLALDDANVERLEEKSREWVKDFL